jgi:RNA polymerase sigma-70 factor (ECF subfamily)
MIAANQTDQQLLAAFRNENTRNAAFEAIVLKYQQKVYWHCRRMVIDHDDADDVTQNTFIRAWENLANFREESKLFTWLFRVATNEALAFLNKKKSAMYSRLDDAQAELANKITSGEGFSGNAIQRKLQLAILALPDKQRAVFNMRYYDELPYEEIAEITGTSVGALKASYHHAVKKIEILIQRD